MDCRNQNVKLYTIFEDEWNQSKNIIKNRILIAIGRAIRGTAARKLHVKNIKSQVAIDFLNQYHLQGGVPSSVYLGAFDHEKLVSVITFKRSATAYELNRFASDFCIYPGIFSKMLKYFERNYQYSYIYSFSDNRWSWGEVYEKNGFNVDSAINPDYFVTDYRVREHKFRWRKDRIKARFNIDIDNKTELTLIRDLGWDRIWDCGKIKWIKHKK
jgi:hypothetical protein